jgi:Flp pilus assembly protein TadG
VQQLFTRLRREDGQALVELAFVIPIVLLFLFGIIDFGLALNQQNQDTNMANIGVRAAAVYSGSGGMTCNGTSYSTLATWLNCESTADGGPTLRSVCIYDTSSSANGTSYSTGDPIEVTVGSSFSWLKLLTGQVHSLSSSIGANATMRLETSQISAETPSSSSSPAVLPFFVNPSGC